MSAQPVVGHATYQGDHSHLAGRQEPMGPTYEGAEWRWPVTADYDPETNTTRVAFSHIAPADAR